VVAVAAPVAVLLGGGGQGGVDVIDPATDPKSGPWGEIRVSCGGFSSWPVDVMAVGLDTDLDDAQVRQAFTDLLDEAPMDAPAEIREHGADAPYRVFAISAEEATLAVGEWTAEGPGSNAEVLSLTR
jgi:hypothetical protein